MEQIKQQFKAIIFDMDGTLTDTEPLWKDAMEEVFHAIGCPLKRKDFAITAGMRIDEVIEFWYTKIGWKNVTPKEVEKRIIDKMDELIRQKATPLPGVLETLNFVAKHNYKVGLASSSYEQLIYAVLDTLKIRGYFEIIHSAEREEYGKPHPAVFITVAKALYVQPNECLVIEDSLNGIVSAKAAKMKVVCIPEKTHQPEPKLILADYHFNTMSDFLTDLQKSLSI